MDKSVIVVGYRDALNGVFVTGLDKTTGPQSGYASDFGPVHRQLYAGFSGMIMAQPSPHAAEYLMKFYPVPVLRKPTKRGRLRWQGKMRARERMHRYYLGD